MSIDGPNPSLISREDTSGQAHEAFCKISATLEQSVDIATHICGWVLGKGPLESWETVGLGIYRHMIEMGDAASVLVRQRIDHSCSLLARSQFEAYLCLRFLLAGDRAQLASAFLFCEKYDGYLAAKGLLKRIDDGEDADRGEIALIYKRNEDKARRAVEEWERSEKQQRNDSIKSAWQSARKTTGHRVPKWYSFWDGPRDVRDLARSLEEEVYYIMLYKHWSAKNHVASVLTSFESHGARSASMLGFRNGLAVPQYAIVMHALLNGASMHVVKAMTPEKTDDFGKWYLNTGRPSREWLKNVKFVWPPTEDQAGAE